MPRNGNVSDLIADPAVRERWERVRRYFFLRESTYDMTRRCNIRCEGCYYFEGDKQHAAEVRDPAAWRALMQAERERGITYVVLAGAEPSLVPELLAVCFDEMPLGAIATNGLQRIPESVGYKIHISVWGNDATSLRIRRAENMLARQIDNYRGDPRAVFVYTFTPHNIVEAARWPKHWPGKVAGSPSTCFPRRWATPGSYAIRPSRSCRPVGPCSTCWRGTRRALLYSAYNAVAHTHRRGLHDLFGCSYPRCNPSTDIGLGRSFRQYRTDLNWDREAACCVPDTDCPDCRHYAAGSAVVTARLFRHACDPNRFNSWLDYVDTYLAVWVMDYAKGANLCQVPVRRPVLIFRKEKV